VRIWITGVGVVSPLARSAGPTMDALLAGKRAMGPVTLFETLGARADIAAEVAGIDPAAFAPSGAEGWSRTDVMAVLAAREALGQSGIGPADDLDLILGGTTAGMLETEGLLAEMHRDPTARKPLERMLSHPLSATVDRLREVVAPFRTARTICSACSSGANALLLAAAWLRNGTSQRVLAGGADGLCRLTYAGFSCLAALSPAPCRPFDRDRDGLNLGEGAAFLVLETEAAARARGVDPIAELRGWAVGAEAHHITNPQPSGETAARVMAAALRRARIAPDAVDYVNAHGTATKLNDKMESAALHLAFGAAVEKVPVSSTKGQIGHTLGAAGAIEAAIAVMAISRGALPPTGGLENIDPECSLVHLQQAREARVRVAMSNSFGFGGADTVVVLTAPNAFPDLDDARPTRVWVTAAATVGGLGVANARQSAAYLEPGDPPAAGALDFDAAKHLDLDRARRIDRAGRLAATAMEAGFVASGAARDPEPLEQAGAIIGGAFGSVDACSAFIHRVYEKGVKFASPAVFPNLLPSSPVAHAAIYHQLRGPVFASADLGATSESAIVTASELITAGEAELMIAGGVEEVSAITEAVLGPLCSGSGGAGALARGEGAAVLFLESAVAAGARGAKALAEVAWYAGWRGSAAGRLADAPVPQDRALVLVAHDDARVAEALAGSAWADVPRQASAPRAGGHEGAGGFAAAAACGKLGEGALDIALVLGLAPDRGYAFVLRRVGAA
jgi:3-oxoacyl-[acyl-carrier-protein] synthase II